MLLTALPNGHPNHYGLTVRRSCWGTEADGFIACPAGGGSADPLLDFMGVQAALLPLDKDRGHSALGGRVDPSQLTYQRGTRDRGGFSEQPHISRRTHLSNRRSRGVRLPGTRPGLGVARCVSDLPRLYFGAGAATIRSN